VSIGLGPHLRMVALGVLAHWCPACDRVHNLVMGHRDTRKLDWDHNTQHPTFSPDVRQVIEGGVCHYFITAGHIEFLPDSTHILAGKTVALPAFPFSATAMSGAAPPADPLP
jgi:hypothetical protein